LLLKKNLIVDEEDIEEKEREWKYEEKHLVLEERCQGGEGKKLPSS